MKKRMLALAIAGVLVFGSSISVFAEETETEAAGEVQALTMEMMDAELYEGSWVSFIGGYDLYLPSDWNVMELSEEDAANDIIFHAIAADDSGWNVAVTETELPEDATSVDDIAAQLAEAGYTDVSVVTINDIPVCTYSTEEALGIAFTGNEGTLMHSINLAPYTEDFMPTAQNIMLSLSESEAVETETEAAE